MCVACFYRAEEVENLEKDLEKTMKETEDLKNKQRALLEQLQQQEELNKALRQKHLQQEQSSKDLETELETKNELVQHFYRWQRPPALLERGSVYVCVLKSLGKALTLNDSTYLMCLGRACLIQ